MTPQQYVVYAEQNHGPANAARRIAKRALAAETPVRVSSSAASRACGASAVDNCATALMKSGWSALPTGALR